MKRLLKPIDILSHIVLIGFLVSVVLLALASSLLRHLSPSINDFRASILEKINAQNPSIHIDAKKIESEWDIFRPELILSGVSVKSRTDSNDLDLEKMHVRVDFLKTLLKQEIYFDYFGLSNIDITLIQEEDGQWSFASIKNKKNENADAMRVVQRFWQIEEIALKNIKITLKPLNEKTIHLPDMTATLQTIRSQKQFVVEFNEGKEKIAKAVISTRHHPNDKNFLLNAYVNIQQSPILAIVGAFLPETEHVDGDLTAELWMNWKQQKLQSTGKLKVEDLRYSGSVTALGFTEFDTRFYADYSDKQWQVGVRNAQLNMGEAAINFSPIKIIKDDKFTIQIRSIDLGEVYDFASVYPLPEKLRSVLDALMPQGDLKNIKVELGANTPFKMQTNLKRVSVSAWNGAPALGGVSGYLEASQNEGFIRFDDKQFSLFFPRLYDAPMLFDEASGLISWQIGDDDVEVLGRYLKLNSQSGKALGEFTFGLPKVKDILNPPRLSLSIGMRDTAAQYRDIYIPYIVNPSITQWLDNNIHGGQLPEVAFIYNGPTAKDAVEPKAVQLWLKVNDSSMSFANEWPNLEKLTGEFLLDDGYGFARAQNAIIKNIPLNETVFEMSPENGGTQIRVSTQLNASASAAKSLLEIQSLSDQLNHVLDNWDMKNGSVDAKLNVVADIVNGKAEVNVDLLTELSDLSIYMPDYNAQIDAISGGIYYSTKNGLSSQNLRARFLGENANISIFSEKNAADLNTKINVKMPVSIGRLAKWTKQPLLAFLKGQALVDASVYFGSSGSGVEMKSKLKGVVIDLPKPFGKRTEQEKELSIHMPFVKQDQLVTVQYGGGVGAKFKLKKAGVDAGIIGLGLTKAEMEPGKIIVSGQVRSVNADEWMSVIDRYKKLVEKNKGEKSSNDNLIFMVKNLRIKTLDAYEQSLESVSVDLFNAYTYWQLSLNHKDLMANLKIYEGDKPMDLHIQSVNLEFLSKKQAESGVGLASQDLSNFPDINVVIDKLWSNGEDFGEWQFDVRSYEDRMALENIRSSFKALRLVPIKDEDAILYWTFGPTGKTYFKGGFITDNFANVLKAWGYKQEVHSKSANFMVNAQWNGAPTQFSLTNISATCQFKMEQGNFADVGAGKSDALKFIGVFNIANLLKRLQLDFTDLTSKGLAYDSVEGLISANDGVYSFQKPIIVKTPTSKVRFYGNVDMNTELLNVTMGVTLPLASNLPWIVALAAGLPTAAGVYIVSKMLDKQVDQLSSAVYQVTGPLSEPEIKFDSLFDSEDGYEKQEKKKKRETKKPEKGV